MQLLASVACCDAARGAAAQLIRRCCICGAIQFLSGEHTATTRQRLACSTVRGIEGMLLRLDASSQTCCGLHISNGRGGRITVAERCDHGGKDPETAPAHCVLVQVQEPYSMPRTPPALLRALVTPWQMLLCKNMLGKVQMIWGAEITVEIWRVRRVPRNVCGDGWTTRRSSAKKARSVLMRSAITRWYSTLKWS